ncbi:hypothetical protein [Sphingomonas sp. 179-A 2A2 NHS]|uniref:hypothetical protein n=1 Tax=Sphingomonas sp. 179-A 2A2 NHS TaxID=3374290 RepID=UPI003879B09A
MKLAYDSQFDRIFGHVPHAGIDDANVSSDGRSDADNGTSHGNDVLRLTGN